MIAVDTNVLLYAHNPAARQHALALQRIQALADTRRPWAIPLQCAVEFLRLATHPHVLRRPMAEARASLDALFDDGGARLLVPPPSVWLGFGAACDDGAPTGNVVFDALIVATCRAHGVTEIATEDRDFTRFRGFRAVRLSDDWRAWLS